MQKISLFISDQMKKYRGCPAPIFSDASFDARHCAHPHTTPSVGRDLKNKLDGDGQNSPLTFFGAFCPLPHLQGGYAPYDSYLRHLYNTPCGTMQRLQNSPGRVFKDRY